MEIKVVKVNNGDDFLNNLLTTDDLGEILAQSMIDRVKRNPIEYVESLRKYNIINDKEYKEMLMNIRKDEMKGDFTND